MPQFDVVVYSNEILWLFFFFVLLYSFNYLFFFPRVSEILKTRVKKIELDLINYNKFNKKWNNFFLEKENYFFNTILLSSFNTYLNLSLNLSLIEKISVYQFNISIQYYLNSFYKFFDFYELENF